MMFLAKTMAGLEQVLADEIKSLGAEDINILQRAVSFCGSKALMYKANYLCRSALRILKPIDNFEVRNEDDLYKRIFNIKWERFLDLNKTFAIDSNTSGNIFTNSLYVSQKAKDAIADRFFRHSGKRPSVDIKDPDLRINIHISGTFCTVSLDSSGSSLHKRGYRRTTGLAPVSEVLAAGLIMLSGWKGESIFIDPMCGAGTFLIEAAMIAKNIPSGYFRKDFGFMRWKDFEKHLWKDILNQAASAQKDLKLPIYGSDISELAVITAKVNIIFAGLENDISLSCSSFADFSPVFNLNNELKTANSGLIMMNPPYGERLKQDKIIELYKGIGDTLKKKYSGFEAWIISSDMDALKFVGLKPSRKIKVFNGPLECRFEKFELYSGSRKIR